MIKQRNFTILALLVVALSHCSSPQQVTTRAEPLRARDYFPLSSRAAWSFDSSDTTTPSVPGLVTMSVVRDDSAGGFYIRLGNGTPSIYEYQQRGVTRNNELFLRDPIEPNSRWQSDSGDTYEIRQVNLQRTVPAGTFSNVIEVVRTANEPALHGEYQETYFYAPRVGPIEAFIPIVLPNHQVHRFHLVLRGYTLTGEF